MNTMTRPIGRADPVQRPGDLSKRPKRSGTIYLGGFQQRKIKIDNDR